MNKLKQTLEKALKSEPAFCDSESGELNYTKVKDSADKIEEKLISLLADNKDLKNKFFTKIKDVYVFNIQDFKFFLDESKVDNSYTQYANKIGLADNSGLLENRSEVVLDFPFKDCVLEGGQSTEEGTDTYFEYSEKTEKYEEKNGKRNEVFFNQVLAHDEIDRLFDKKALVNWKRFTKDSKKDGEAVKEIKRDKTGLIQENLIIKGNNLLALHSLKSEFAGKIKLIYIDPPYNTGTDGFAYNDRFNHSTWLTFMKNRLEVAQELLKDDGLLTISCDDNEVFYLKVLIDEIFGSNNFIANLIRQTRKGGGSMSKYISTDHDYILVFTKNKEKLEKIYVPYTKEYLKRYKEEDNKGKFFWDTYVRNRQGSSNYYTIIAPDGKKLENAWINPEDKFKQLLKEGEVRFKMNGNSWSVQVKQRLNNSGQILRSLLLDSTNEEGTKQLKDIFGSQIFSYPKPESMIEKIIEAFSSKKDIVLDYHLGSGTTCAVANRMDRQYIGIEQMDYIKTITVPRIKEVLKRNKSDDSFIYCELAKWNEKAKEEIQNAKDLPALVKLFDTLYERYFLNYNVKIKDFKENIIKEDNFKKLTLAQQKKMFLTMLDLNQMYVLESEMVDKKYGIGSEDQKLTKAFYSKK